METAPSRMLTQQGKACKSARVLLPQCSPHTSPNSKRFLHVYLCLIQGHPLPYLIFLPSLSQLCKSAPKKGCRPLPPAAPNPQNAFWTGSLKPGRCSLGYYFMPVWKTLLTNTYESSHLGRNYIWDWRSGTVG